MQTRPNPRSEYSYPYRVYMQTLQNTSQPRFCSVHMSRTRAYGLWCVVTFQWFLISPYLGQEVIIFPSVYQLLKVLTSTFFKILCPAFKLKVILNAWPEIFATLKIIFRRTIQRPWEIQRFQSRRRLNHLALWPALHLFNLPLKKLCARKDCCLH